jgi:hypothetical protein
MFQVERGLSHAMIYTSKIIDLDEERAAGATGFVYFQQHKLNACRRLDNIRQQRAGGA